MKNHFFFGYPGNKREEVKTIYDYLDLNNKKNIDTIVEPFCGTSALSYYIWLNNKDKNYKYILNDSDPFLIELYLTIKDDEKFIKLKKDMMNLYESIFNIPEEKRKEKYLIMKKNNTFLSWFFTNKFYTIRKGLFPLNHIYSEKKIDNLFDVPIIDFLKNANITMTNEPGIETYKKYCNNANVFLFIDPPYLISYNGLYDLPNGDIYEYLCENPITNNNSYILLCLENNWIIKLLFKNNKNIVYDKTYKNGIIKKKTTHIIISNKE